MHKTDLSQFLNFLKLEIPNIIQIFTLHAFLVFVFRDSNVVNTVSAFIFFVIFGVYFWEKARTHFEEKHIKIQSLDKYIAVTGLGFVLVEALFVQIHIYIK